MDGSTEHNEVRGTHQDLPPVDEDGTQVILLELERILNSRPFRSSSRSKQFLSYVVRNSLDGHIENLKERTIGTEVFERDPDYATGDDPVVRVNAGEVRRRLEQYYYGAPIDTPVRIEIPLGSYIPEFHWTSKALDLIPSESGTQAVAEPASSGLENPAEPVVSAIRPAAESRIAIERAPRVSRERRWMIAGMIVLAAGCVALWIQNRALDRSIYAWQYKPSVSAFWSGILSARPDTDIVMADSSFSLVQIISKKSFSFQDYLSRSYISQLQALDLSPEMRTALNLVASKNLESASDVRLAQRILTLDPSGKNIHLYFAREYLPALIKQDNVILIGSPIANPWDELFESRMNFTVIPNSDVPTYITNRAPTAGEQSTYTPTASVGYCTVAYLPNPDHNGSVLLLEGTGSEATEAAGDFLLSEDQLSSFLKTLNVTRFPYFEVLLKTAQVKGTPLSTTLVAYRTYPGQH